MLDSRLKNFRHEKLKRKLPIDAQLLECAKEELKVKKRLVEQMCEVDKQYSENMTKLKGNMEKLTNSIADGFSLLRNLLTLQPQLMFPAYPPMYNSNAHANNLDSFMLIYYIAIILNTAHGMQTLPSLSELLNYWTIFHLTWNISLEVYGLCTQLQYY